MLSGTALNACFVRFNGGVQQLAGEDTTIILPAVFGSICAVGIVGNMLVLVILIHNIMMKKSASGILVMLANISGTDLLILAVCSSTRAVTYRNRIWTLGHFACKTTEWFQHGCLAAKCLTLAVMSRARYHSHRKIKTVLVATGSVWLLGLALSVFEIVFSRLQMKGNFSLCLDELPSHSTNFMRVYSAIYALVIYVFPVIFSALCHLRAIFRNARGHGARSERRTEIRLALLSLTASNALLLLPEWTVWMWHRLRPREICEPPVALLVITQVCMYLSSASSPAILLTMFVPLRENLTWLLCRGESSEEKQERGAIAVGAPGDETLIHTDALGRPLPDLKIFWIGRRSTTDPDNNDPLPWDRKKHWHAQL